MVETGIMASGIVVCAAEAIFPILCRCLDHLKTNRKFAIAFVLMCSVSSVVTSCSSSASRSLVDAEEEFMNNMASGGNFRVVAREAIGREIVDFRKLRMTWPTKPELIELKPVIEFSYMIDSTVFLGKLTSADYDFHSESQEDEQADYSIKLGDAPARTVTANINWL